MVNPRNILIIGITGNGKSTLANVLADEEIFKESAGGSSETRNHQINKFELNGINYHVIDNIGFDDNRNKMSTEFILYEIGKSIYAAKEGIDQVFFVFKGKFSPEQIKSFKLFESLIFESGITKFTTLVRSNFEDFRNSQECEKDRQALLKESIVIREIIESCNGIVHVDNPSLPTIKEKDSENQKTKKEEKRKRNKEKRDYSREKVLKHLAENCHDVYKLKEWDNIYSTVANHLKKEEEINQSNSLTKQEELEKAKSQAIAEIKIKLERELSEFSNLAAVIEQNTQK